MYIAVHLPGQVASDAQADHVWESAQEQLGDSIASLFSQFLRERMNKMDALVHVIRTNPGQANRAGEFIVMVAPVAPTGNDGPPGSRLVSGREQLVRSLAEVGLRPQVIAQVETGLKRQNSVSVREILPRPAASRMRTAAWVVEKPRSVDRSLRPSYYLERVRDIPPNDLEFRILHAPGGVIDRRPGSVATEGDLQMTRWYKEINKHRFFLAGSPHPWSIRRTLEGDLSSGIYIVLRAEV